MPEFVYTPIYDERHKAIAISKGEGAQVSVRKVQKGWRDRLLCSDCEQHLNRHIEQPCLSAWSTLLGEDLDSSIGIQRLSTPDGPVGLYFTGLDYRTLKLFFLSILWRVGVSSLAHYHEVNLGDRHIEELRRRLIELDPGERHEYACFVYLASEGNAPVGPAGRFRFDGHRCYRMILTKVVLHIIVSRHFKGNHYEYMALSPAGTLITGYLELSKLSEVQDVARLARSVPSSVRARYRLY